MDLDAIWYTQGSKNTLLQTDVRDSYVKERYRGSKFRTPGGQNMQLQIAAVTWRMLSGVCDIVCGRRAVPAG